MIFVNNWIKRRVAITLTLIALLFIQGIFSPFNLLQSEEIQREAVNSQSSSIFSIQPLKVSGAEVPFSRVLVGDSDGDGREELLIIQDPQQRLFRGALAANQQIILEEIENPFTDLISKNIYLGDFNGDKKSDILMVHSFTSQNDNLILSVAIATSDTKFDTKTWQPFSLAQKNFSQLLIGDLNGDGRDDLLIQEPEQNKLDIAYSNGSNKFEPASLLVNLSMTPSNIVLGDLNGDGLNEIVFSARDQSKWYDGFNDIDFYADEHHNWYSITPQKTPEQAILWATFPTGLATQSLILANIDRYLGQEIMLMPKNSRHWWTAFSSSMNGIEIPLPPIFENEKAWNPIVKVDFDGDKVDEILIEDESSNWLLLSLKETTTKEFSQGAVQIRAVQIQDDSHGPFVCIAYNPGDQSFKWGETIDNCPKGYTYYSLDDRASHRLNAESIPLVGSCCRLPANDILTDQHKNAAVRCPEDYVATGAAQQNNVEKVIQDRFIRCTKINTKRYQLGPDTKGAYWGAGLSMREENLAFRKNQIPLAIRYAVGRKSFNQWDVDGCIAYPWGSLLVAKSPSTCTGYTFRQLQYRGMKGDPPAGTAVKMYPDCANEANEIDPIDPTKGCRLEEIK